MSSENVCDDFVSVFPVSDAECIVANVSMLQWGKGKWNMQIDKSSISMLEK